MVDYKVMDMLNAPELENVHIMGGIEEQMEKFLYERVLSDNAWNVIYPETEKQFMLKLDDSTPVGMWRGEFWGKWIISACRVARYKHDEALVEFIRNGALNVIATMDEDGYIGSYKDPAYFRPLDQRKAIELVGHPTDWNWNIWCRKYTIWGLIEAYRLTEDARILNAVRCTADQLIALLEREHVRLFDTGTFFGMPSGSIIKPMLQLYRITADEKYLDFCVTAANEWAREDGMIPNLIKNAESGLPVHRWYPWYKYPYRYGWAKAYEMMSCLDGLIELYRVTGNKRYFDAVETIYCQLYEHESNQVCSVGFNDIFLHASELINSISEPCDVIHWMRISFELYKLTGKARYMDSFESAFLNPFLAASFSDGKWGARGVRSCGRHLVAENQSSMKYSHCCVNNMPRGYMNAAQAFVFEKGGDLYINMYTDYECEIADRHVKIAGSYLENGHVAVTLSKPARVFLRIPSWSRETIINARHITDKGEYVCVEHADRIEIVFDMNARLDEFKKQPERFEDDDPRYVRFLSGNSIPAEYLVKDRRCRVLYGPLLLTRSRKNGNSVDEMFGSETVCGKGYACSVQPVPSAHVRNAFDVTLDNGRDTKVIRMCDYATGSNEWSKDDEALFNIFI